MKLIVCLALLLSAACSRSGQVQSIVLDGVAYVDGDGNISVRDAQSHRWLSVYPDEAANIPPEIADFRSTFRDRCWFRVYGVRASGTIFGKDNLQTKSIFITQRYSDAEVPVVLDRIQFQPLKTKHTCGSG